MGNRTALLALLTGVSISLAVTKATGGVSIGTFIGYAALYTVGAAIFTGFGYALGTWFLDFSLTKPTEYKGLRGEEINRQVAVGLATLIVVALIYWLFSGTGGPDFY